MRLITLLISGLFNTLHWGKLAHCYANSMFMLPGYSELFYMSHVSFYPMKLFFLLPAFQEQSCVFVLQTDWQTEQV